MAKEGDNLIENISSIFKIDDFFIPNTESHIWKGLNQTKINII